MKQLADAITRNYRDNFGQNPDPIRTRLIAYHEERAESFAGMLSDQALYESKFGIDRQFSIKQFIERVSIAQAENGSITAEMRDRMMFHREAADYLKDIAG